jgi:hypothetical protein
VSYYQTTLLVPLSHEETSRKAGKHIIQILPCVLKVTSEKNPGTSPFGTFHLQRIALYQVVRKGLKFNQNIVCLCFSSNQGEWDWREM